MEASYGGTPEMTKEQALASKEKFDNPYDLRYNTNRVVNNTDGSIVGYKYFNFDAERLKNPGCLMLVFRLIPEGIEGTIDIMMDRPWESQGGKKIGEMKLTTNMDKKVWDVAGGLSDEAKNNDLAGKHAIYLVFKSDIKEKSLCTLLDFYFTFAPVN